MFSSHHWIPNLLFISILLSTFIWSACDSTKELKRGSFEKPKFIIQLDHTKLQVSELVRDLDEIKL